MSLRKHAALDLGQCNVGSVCRGTFAQMITCLDPFALVWCLSRVAAELDQFLGHVGIGLQIADPEIVLCEVFQYIAAAFGHEEVNRLVDHAAASAVNNNHVSDS